MRLPRINTSFAGHTDSNFLTKSTHISTSMANPIFVAPVPTLDEVTAAVGTYADALIAAENLGRNNVIAKNQIQGAFLHA